MLDRWKERSHWMFWLALVVLVANDHWLKGSHLAPGWLTGKLSDFAGLLVAPVLLAILVRARRSRARLACLAAVALLFASFELFPAWVRAMESLDIAGHRLRMWPDLTDLLAFAILPITWWMMAQVPEHKPLRLGGPRVHRWGIALASLACIATSSSGTPPPSPPLILNQSHAPVTVTARRYLGVADCSGEDGGSSEPRLDDGAPLATDFGPEMTVTIEPADFVELGTPSEKLSCAAYWISAKALGGLIITFERVPRHDYDREYNSLALEGPSSELRAFANPGVWISSTPAPANEAP